MVLDNRTATFDPLNTGSPYYPGVKRMRWVRVTAQWLGVTYPRWQGVITTWEQSWPAAGRDAVCTVQATDALGVLNLLDLVGQTFPSQTTDQRVKAVCDLAGLSYSLDTGLSTLVAVTTALGSTNALSHLQDVEDTENGRLFAGPDGVIVFQNRHWRMDNALTPVGTVGDAGGEIPYKDATLTSDDTNLWNSVAVTTTNADGSQGAREVSTNAASETDYFARSTFERTILSNDTSEALACAQYLVGLYADPKPKLPQVDLQLVRRPSLWPVVLGLGNGDRVTWHRSAVADISTDGYVELVAEQINPDHATWKTSLQLLPADDQVGWILEDPVYGILDETTRPIY